MKRSITFITFLTGLIIILSVLQVVISNRLSTTGISLVKLEEEIKALKKENLLLSEKLLVSSSFTHISSAASDQGFVEGKKYIFITPGLPIAVKP